MCLTLSALARNQMQHRCVFFHDLVDDGEEWFQVERLGQIISSAKNEQPLDLAWRGVSANDNDGNARCRRIALQTLDYFRPMFVRQVKVE
jgi:hypothetical protein